MTRTRGRQQAPGRRRRHRDRHGRGLRGPLYPQGVPAAASRGERFDALVLESLEPIEQRWRDELADLDIAVDEVPEPAQQAEEGVLADRTVPLARLFGVGVDGDGLPTKARIVLYRRPLESRARDSVELAELVTEILIEEVASYLGIDPDTVAGG